MILHRKSGHVVCGHCTVLQICGLWLAGNEGIEKQIEPTRMSYIGITIRIHSFGFPAKQKPDPCELDVLSVLRHLQAVGTRCTMLLSPLVPTQGAHMQSHFMLKSIQFRLANLASRAQSTGLGEATQHLFHVRGLSSSVPPP